MHPETEVHFCNICNSSIPEAAIRDGKAVRIDGKVIPTAAGGAPVEGLRSAKGAVFGAAVLICAAIAGATVFIDWRLSEETAGLRQGVDDSAPRIGRLEERLTTLEERLVDVARSNQFALLDKRLDGFADTLRQAAEVDARGTAEAQKERNALRDQIQRVGDAQVQHAARLALLQDDLRALGRDLAELKAAPSASVRSPVDDGGRGSALDPRGETPMAPDALPPALQHQVDRLGDADESVRFEAVQELLASHDGRVLQKLVPLAKDTDFLVRRLVLEGLADHKSAEHVELMLTALADPESLVRHSAYQGLKKLSGQSFPFDADAAPDQRGAMQRRWKSWWDKAKADF